MRCNGVGILCSDYVDSHQYQSIKQDHVFIHELNCSHKSMLSLSLIYIINIMNVVYMTNTVWYVQWVVIILCKVFSFRYCHHNHFHYHFNMAVGTVAATDTELEGL